MRHAVRLLFTCLLIALLLGMTPSTGFAQDEGWIDSLTVDGEPPWAKLDPNGLNPMFDRRRDRGWFATVAHALRAILPLRAPHQNAALSRSISRSAPWGSSRPLLKATRSVGVLHAGATLESMELRCAGGARSWHPDVDITIWIGIWVEGSGTVASNQATGYMPNTVAVTSIGTVGYDRRLECALYAGGAQAQATGTILADCGDERTYMREEYRAGNVNYNPACGDFASSGGSAHFSWNELNGGFTNGNPHSPWGIITSTLTSMLEDTRTNYNRGGITLSSGYRCPHGNANVDGVMQSLHMHGKAADMYSAGHQWTEAEFNLLKDAADDTSPTESFSWDTYTDHHYHAAW